MPTCPSCGEPKVPGEFCVRCGAPQDAPPGPSRHRTQFAAAPAQRRLAPWLVSTLFPHLPRHAERAFHLALGAGVVLVAGLAVAGLYPVALLSAALLMPVLTGLYFFDVDVRGGEPPWAWLVTFGWGAAVGAAAGALSRWSAPGSSALLDRTSTFHAVVGGVALPAGALLAALLGPALLLRRPRFSTALDGATLAAASAATCAACQAAVSGVGLLGAGLRPAGALAPWLERLLAIGVATPVLMMSAGGGAGAALWLRYRAPVKDRRALGWLGSPPAAVGLGCGLLALGAVGETVLAAGAWLAWLVVLDLVALVLLRRAIHVGLLEEAAERPIGADLVCANCGQPTPMHAFCAHCGIAQAALPRHHQGRLSAGGPFRAHRRLAALVAGSVVVLAIGFPVVVIAAPAARAPRCPLHRRCGRPPVVPVAPPASAAAPRYVSWRSAGLGYRLRYLSSQWQAGTSDARSLTLQAPDGVSQLTVSASTAAPPAAVAAQAAALGGQLLGVTSDAASADEILGPAVGERPGVSEILDGTTVSPQGPQTPVRAEIMAAAQRRSHDHRHRAHLGHERHRARTDPARGRRRHRLGGLAVIVRRGFVAVLVAGLIAGCGSTARGPSVPGPRPAPAHPDPRLLSRPAPSRRPAPGHDSLHRRRHGARALPGPVRRPLRAARACSARARGAAARPRRHRPARLPTAHGAAGAGAGRGDREPARRAAPRGNRPPDPGRRPPQHPARPGLAGERGDGPRNGAGVASARGGAGRPHARRRGPRLRHRAAVAGGHRRSRPADRHHRLLRLRPLRPGGVLAPVRAPGRGSVAHLGRRRDV